MQLSLKKYQKSKKVSLTPLIDVVFLLLVFFMLSSTFLKFITIPIAGGKATAGNSIVNDDLIIITITVDQKIKIDREDTTLDAVAEILTKISKKRSINQAVIKPEKGVKVQKVIEVLQSAKKSNLKNVMLVR